MSRIRSTDTGPERVVRSLIHRLGFRFRLNSSRKLPGSPDIVLRRHRIAVFVHGCFWHRHGCPYATFPKSRRDFWKRKFEQNVSRDRRVKRELLKMEWKVVVVWSCELRNLERLQLKLMRLLTRYKTREAACRFNET